MSRRGSCNVQDQHVHTAIFKMDNHLGPTVQHMELCSMLCGSLDGKGDWGRECLELRGEILRGNQRK